MLVYLRGLGILPPDSPAAAPSALRLGTPDHILCRLLTLDRPVPPM